MAVWANRRGARTRHARASAGAGGARRRADRTGAEARIAAAAFLNIEAAEPSHGPTVRPCVALLEYRPMADESKVLPTSRIARWVAIAAVIVFTVALYFRDGRRLPPLTPTATQGQPAN